MSDSINSSFLHTCSNISESQQKYKEEELKTSDPQNQDNDEQEINRLMQKIQEQEIQFVKMQKYYHKKIEDLYYNLSQEDKKYNELKKSLLELKKLTEQHKSKVQCLHANGDKTDRTIKSPQRYAGYSPKNNVQSPKSTDNSNPTSARSNGIKPQSPSRQLRKLPMFHKASLNQNQSIKTKDNISSDHISKKSQQKSQAISPSNKFGRNLKTSSPGSIDNKKSKGLGFLKEKAPFK